MLKSGQGEGGYVKIYILNCQPFRHFSWLAFSLKFTQTENWRIQSTLEKLNSPGKTQITSPMKKLSFIPIL